MFRTNEKFDTKKTVRLILKASSPNQIYFPHFTKHQEVMLSKLISGNIFMTNYGASLVTVMAHQTKRKIEALVAMDPVLFPDPVYHRCFSQPINFWLKQKGHFFLHAGCVAENNQGVLIVGSSGAGKSVLSLSAVRAGFKFLGDEQPILSMENGSVKVSAFPRRIRIDSKVAEVFPELSGLRKMSPEKRLVFRIEQIWPNSETSSCQPKVLIFPKFHQGIGTIEKKRLDSSVALAKLLKDDYFVLFQTSKLDRLSQKHLLLFERLVHQTTAFEILYDTKHIPEIPTLFRKLINS